MHSTLNFLVSGSFCSPKITDDLMAFICRIYMYVFIRYVFAILEIKAF